MGVTGLWKLIEASGKPVPLETLENKVLAIDISIWLHQVVKGYQDNKGGQLPNAHLLGLFNRICKLLYFRIKPVFVFDGGCPELKRKTIAKRAQSKTKIQSEADRLEVLLLESLAKEKIVKQALGDPEKFNLSPPKLSKASKTEQRDDMFKLPPLKEELAKLDVKAEDEEDDEDEDFCPKRSYDVNINQIDVTSSHFKSLPADIRHDILTDIKETRKQNSWARLRELPVESQDFSGYQMSRLLRRRQVQVGLEEAEQEMGGKTWTLGELEALLSEDGVLEADKHCQKIASDENTRFLLVRDIAKAMSEAKNQAGPSTSKAAVSEPSDSTPIESLDEEDLDLQRAIQLSLGNEPEEVETDGRVKLNPQQRQKFSSTIQTHGLIRGFMMEYAEMNDTDIKELMESTQASAGDVGSADSFREKFPHTDEYVLYGTPKKTQAEETIAKKAQEVTAISDVDTDDEDLVEVQEKKVEINEQSANNKSPVVITVQADLKNFSQEEDLFADVFEDSAQDLKSIPDVEVASISSDDTVPYDFTEEDERDSFKESETESKAATKHPSGTESGFVSEEVKPTEPFSNGLADLSENEKFWKEAESDEAIEEPEASAEPVEEVPELSENEKFWAVADEIIEIPDTREKSPPPAKIASPFFVNRKTPTSKEKQKIDAPSTSRSVAKNLFSANAIELAANELKNDKTYDEILQMKGDLVDEQKNIGQSINKMERMGASISDSMSRDCKELLKLFGIPFVNSPMEAEAQCAFLNMIQLTDGTISDDSDIWLFGGQTVYKNFFVQKKIVMEFSHESIDQMFHLNRNKLIQLAMLVGSDYTVGVNGIGAVTALEILAAFPPTEVEAGTDEYQSLISSLRKFREWFQTGKLPGPGGKTVLKSKLKNVELIEGFPNINIARAYLEPIVDNNTEPFTWGSPDEESLIEFAKAKLGWTRLKTEEILAPVMKRLNEKKQSTIKDYFKSQVTKKFFDREKMSKRVQTAVNKMGGKEEPEAEKPKKATKRKVKAKPEEENLEGLIFLSSDEELGAPPEKKSSPEPKSQVASTSGKQLKTKPTKAKTVAKSNLTQRKRKPADDQSSTNAGPSTSDVKKRAPRIPNTKQIIPQLEKEKEEQAKAKQKAIDYFKKGKKT